MGLGIIGWIVIGIVAGWLAEQVMGRNHGLLTNLIVGVVGALLGGFIAGNLLGIPVGGFNLITLLALTLSVGIVIDDAIVVLENIYRLMEEKGLHPFDAAIQGTREIGLAVLALACLLYVMDLTVLHLAVPAMSADLQPTSTQLLWIIDIYGFLVAGSLITMGTLGDRIGRRKLLMIGAACLQPSACAVPLPMR